MPRKRASRRPSRIRHRRRGKSTKKSTEQTTIDAKRSVSIDNPAKQQVADMEDIAKQFRKLFPQQMEEAKALQKKKHVMKKFTELAAEMYYLVKEESTNQSGAGERGGLPRAREGEVHCLIVTVMLFFLAICEIIGAFICASMEGVCEEQSDFWTPPQHPSVD